MAVAQEVKFNRFGVPYVVSLISPNRLLLVLRCPSVHVDGILQRLFPREQGGSSAVTNRAHARSCEGRQHGEPGIGIISVAASCPYAPLVHAFPGRPPPEHRNALALSTQ